MARLQANTPVDALIEDWLAYCWERDILWLDRIRGQTWHNYVQMGLTSGLLGL